MKKSKWRILYFLPAILFLAIVLAAGGITVLFTAPVTMVNILVLIAAGIVLSKGKVWGAYLGIVYGAGWIIYDILYHRINNYGRHFPLEVICIPLIIYYIYCAIAVKTKPENK